MKECEICGAPLTARQTRFCSRPCAIKGNTLDRKAKPERWAAHRERAAQWQKDNRDKANSYKVYETRVCGWCKEPFETRVDNPATGCCGAHSRWAKQGRGPTCRVPYRRCPECGRVRVDREGGAARCESCRSLHVKPRYAKWIGKARRRRIYERDKWTCQICGEPVDRDDLFGHWAPSLDHIKPRSQGGTNEDANLRCAHMWCNAVRSDESYYTDADLRAS